MKTPLLLLSFAFATACLLPAQDATLDPAAVEAAKSLMATMDMEKIMAESLEAGLGAQLEPMKQLGLGPEGMKELEVEMLAFLKEVMSWQSLEPEFVKLYVEEFTLGVAGTQCLLPVSDRKEGCLAFSPTDDGGNEARPKRRSEPYAGTAGADHPDHPETSRPVGQAKGDFRTGEVSRAIRNSPTALSHRSHRGGPSWRCRRPSRSRRCRNCGSGSWSGRSGVGSARPSDLPLRW